LGGGFAALDGLEDDTLSKWQRKQKKRREQTELEESMEADEMEQQLAKAHSLDTASKTANRAPAKHPRYSSAQIEEMTVRQLKRALEERGESFDLAWVGRPDERKLLQQHATSLRTMCTDASSGPDATGTTHSHSHSHLGPDADSVDEFARFRDLRAISEPDAGSLDSWGGHPRRFRVPLRSSPAPAVPPSAPGQRVAGSPQGPSRGDPISDRGDPISDHGDPISERGDPISDRGDPISGRGDPISGQRPGSPQGQPEPSGQPSRPASTAVPPCAPAYREGLQVQVQDQPPDGTFEKIKRRLEQESMARLRGRPTHFINPAHVWSENGPNRMMP